MGGVDMQKLISQLKRHEGFRAYQYLDTMGIPTIGYGYNLKANPEKLTVEQKQLFKLNGITEKFASDLLEKRIAILYDRLEDALSFWNELNEARQSVLLNMAFNLGLSGLFKFEKAIRLINQDKYFEAALELLNSIWTKQVKTRALELAYQMATGEFLND